jgi:hypothetical protein
MKSFIRLALIVSLLSATTHVFGQTNQNKSVKKTPGKTSQTKSSNPLILDLAEVDPGQIQFITENNHYTSIIIRNAFIDSGYSIKIDVKNGALFPPLEYSGSSVRISFAVDIPTGCANLQAKYNNLKDIFDPGIKGIARSEKEIGKKTNELQNVLDTTKCKDPELLSKAQNLIASCSRTINKPVDITDGDDVTIIVSCGNGARKWTWEFVGKPVGVWLLTYGFGFCSMALEGQTYHVNQINDTSFQIQKDPTPGALDLRFIPAVFYSFLPASKYKDRFNWSISAGLGFDLTAPVVFFGGGFMYRQNIGINIGVAFQQQSRLKPQYSEGEIIKTTLEKDQLHDNVYRPNLFIAINFRFGSNPFKNNSK